MNNELRPYWRKIFSFNWKLGLFLILIICVPRFILVLRANETADYSAIGIIMVVSAVAPFIFLSKTGRKTIGLTRVKSGHGLLLSFILGIIASIFLYFLGTSLYDNSYQNWYVYIGNSYNIPIEINPQDKRVMFAIMATTGITFSPLGEELFFRGIVHASFAKSVRETKASILDSLAFALTHISHFGLVFVNNEWQFLIFPTIIWTTSMFMLSIVFYWCKKKAGSLWGAIICHAAFNLGMIYSIFYMLD